MKGYWGKIAEVDLSNRKVEFKEIEYDILKKYIGGRGLGAYLYTKYAPEIDVDPLSEKNPIIIATGPLTGTPASTAGRISATTRSPLTGTILDSNAGGMFGAPFKYSGIDAMVILGKSEKPVYILINDDQISIEDASNLWGKGTGETTKELKEKHKVMSVISIGPAAENGVLYGSVMVDGDRGFGRGGLGTVWASKKLKAIAVRGTRRPEINSPEDFKNVHYEIIKLL
ncbi:MAG: aldehyde:ferredoxin oxidoreductase, partial [Thermotogaceae bacterium]|nr:aldehyde:ferredoxin oxidoreductase [Thermotogaceae bacterium]